MNNKKAILSVIDDIYNIQFKITGLFDECIISEKFYLAAYDKASELRSLVRNYVNKNKEVDNDGK